MKEIVEYFYQNLYKENKLQQENQRDYVERKNKLEILEEDRKNLEKDITMEEILEAIKKFRVQTAYQLNSTNNYRR